MAITAKTLKPTAMTEITATATVATAPGRVMTLNIVGSTGDETVEVVDAATAVSTPVKWKLRTNANRLADHISFAPHGLPCLTGIRLVIAGTAPEVHMTWIDES